MLKDVQNQLELTYNEHNAMHSADNAKVMEIENL